MNKYNMEILLITIICSFIFLPLLGVLIILFLKKEFLEIFYKIELVFNNSNRVNLSENSNNNITENNNHLREIELVPMKRYVVIKNPNKEICLGVESS